ncbi:MAG TPA: TIGR03667 family PPOX class F420-dependent oxidoreductase [Methylomirabilota bacterium]|nr:TIGR03667 family PPOX class F420-dependent oxidoreductase [Methylomirabilota bacterium]
MNINTSTEFGARAARRLREDLIGWLVTVAADRTPQPIPVWFWWDGQTCLIYSQPATAKLRNLATNPRVALHLDGDGQGGNIVILTGEARVVTDVPPADRVPEYLEKYRKAIGRIGMTPASFAAAYSVAIRLTPTRLSGH